MVSNSWISQHKRLNMFRDLPLNTQVAGRTFRDIWRIWDTPGTIDFAQISIDSW